MLDLASLRRMASAWDAVHPDLGRFGNILGKPGVTIELMPHLDMQTVIAKENGKASLTAFAVEKWKLELPSVGRATFGPDVSLVWSAPNQWLLVAAPGQHLEPATDALRAFASVSDQGDGRATLRISGPQARTTLSKGIAIDLHPRAFKVGHAATTALIHVSVQLWQIDDESSFVLSVPRTSAGSIWRWLKASAAEFGGEVVLAK